MLKEKVKNITQEMVDNELGGWLPRENLQGMDLIIRSTVLRVAQKIGEGLR